MTLRNVSMSKSRWPASSSITATFRVCICTLGVSLYSSTASQPLSRFTGVAPSWGDHTVGQRLNNLFGRDLSVAVHLVEEQSDCSSHGAGPRPIGQIEAVPGAGQFHVADCRMRNRP